MGLQAGMLLLAMFILRLLTQLYLKAEYLLLCQQFMCLFLDRLMFHLVELPIYQTMDLLMVHPMERLMELLMDILMDCSMDKNTTPMGKGIKNPLTLLIMAL